MLEKQATPNRLRAEQSLGLLLTTWIYRVVLLLLMIVSTGKLGMLPFSPVSTEYAVTMAAYLLLLVVMQDVYHACAIGQARVLELVLSQALANIVSVGLVYLGVVLYMHKLFNPLNLMGVVMVQILVSICWTLICNQIYFRTRRPPRTALIYHRREDMEMLCAAKYFDAQYDLDKVLDASESDVRTLCKQIEDHEAVFVVGVPMSVGNEIAKFCLARNIKGFFSPSIGQIVLAGAKYRASFGVPLLRLMRAGGHSEYRFFKRVFDLCASLVGLILTSPIMLLTALAIWAEDRGPVFYRQVRLTRNGREFNILKFRSMSVNAEEDGVARLAGENDSRITRVGKFIRACRIDELPQLINIIRGDMSIVGPRPERPEIARQYEDTLPEFALRLQVKAGLTGLAQVYGRYNTEPFHKLQMDLMYINEMSFLKDLQLILATIRILFIRESTQGIDQGQATALKNKDSRKAV